jgi:hypothetical protein
MNDAGVDGGEVEYHGFFLGGGVCVHSLILCMSLMHRIYNTANSLCFFTCSVRPWICEQVAPLMKVKAAVHSEPQWKERVAPLMKVKAAVHSELQWREQVAPLMKVKAAVLLEPQWREQVMMPVEVQAPLRE